MAKIIITILIVLSFLIGVSVYAEQGNFGYETQGSFIRSLLINYAYTTRWTSPSDAIGMTAITGYANKILIDGEVKFCVWKYSDGVLVGCTSAIPVTSSGWKTGTLNADLDPSTGYRLGAISGQSTNLYYDSGTADYSASSTNNYNNPTNFTAITTDDKKYSVYVTYNKEAPNQHRFKSDVQFKSNIQIK